MLERLKIVLNNSNLIIHWAINKVFDGCIKIFSVCVYFSCSSFTSSLSSWMWIVHQVIFPSTHRIKLHIVSPFQLRTGVVATHAAFWKSYSLKNLMRLSLPLHCALQCFGKLSRGAHFNSVMSVKYEVKLTASLERCHDDFTLWQGILNSQYLTCRWEKHSLYIFISIMNIIFYILYLLFNERTESENRRYHLAAGKSAHCIPLILSLHIPMLLLQFYLHEH